MRARILAVEDDPVQAKILEYQLRNDYQVTLAATGEACLEAAAGGEFDIVLLDVMLPGISGYQVCRQLKADPAHRDLPVIFLSANFGMDDRLQGFEAGGFDYMVKPVVKAELQRKLELLLAHQEETRTLRSRAESAASTAMTAMSSAAEQGVVLHFLKQALACQTQSAVAEAIIAAAGQFGLDALVQVRGHYETVCRGRDGYCTPIETSVLGNLAGGDRVVELKNRTAINFERVSLLAKNMPVADPERCGRLRDHLATLLEGADARIAALDVDLYLAAESRRLLGAVQAIGRTLADASGRARDLHTQYGEVFNSLANGLEQTIPLLELNVSQEAMLDALVRRASHNYIALADQEAALDRTLAEVTAGLDQLVHPAGQVSATPPA